MRTLDDLDVAGKVVLVRSDLNVPLATGKTGERLITDDGRIRASLPTISDLRSAGAKVVVIAHLGRPKGASHSELSLAPVAARLGELLGCQVPLGTDITGPNAKALIAEMNLGAVVLLENIRFDARERSHDVAERQQLAGELAALGDIYVSDGFGVVHREQASVTDIARIMPCAGGRLVVSETEIFRTLLDSPARPYVVVLGGSKVSDKLAVIDNLISRVDRLLIGGGMAFTFLAAMGYEVGDSLLEPDQLETVKGFIAQAKASGVELLLPVDVIIADAFSADAKVECVPSVLIPSGWRGLDIGPKSAALFAAKIADAGTVVWNGPMGVFEMAPFASGTKTVAEAIASSSGMSVVGGGDSAAAIRILGLDESLFSHISTGGGASLEFLEGKILPGMTVLDEGQ
ncbi:MAG: phosphoglycerate kinase [Actinobacteria bacterium]|uniref:phosphoglycerate kinase n=1 Tax=freshwater metagenome TaxID=449393 RepID=A0A6J7NXZ9_9ZZZZ|nr:phosphoglycerate kinase [Actinomycetota bacterium]